MLTGEQSGAVAVAGNEGRVMGGEMEKGEGWRDGYPALYLSVAIHNYHLNTNGFKSCQYGLLLPNRSIIK